MRERGPVFFFLFAFSWFLECVSVGKWFFGLFFSFCFWLMLFSLVCEIFSLFISKIICFFSLNCLVLGKFCDQTV